MPRTLTPAAMRWSDAWSARAADLRPSEIREFLKLLGNPDMISFAGGIPDPALFPREEMAAAAAAIFGDPVRSAQALQYAESEGYGPLRAWIAGHMGGLGVPCEADNILLTSGSQQGLDLIGKVLLDPGSAVLTEMPAYLGALQAFAMYQPDYVALDPDTPVDARSAVVYAVPDFGNPSGATMTREARETLLALCRAHGLPLVEDAAYQALRYEGEAVPSMLELDIAEVGGIDASRVLYTGTFSKTVSPGLRVGWICAGREVIQRLVLARQAADLHSSMLDQMLVYEVVREGFAAQVAKLLPVYRHRRDVMLQALSRSMPDGVTWTTPEGGMFIWVTLRDGLDSAALVREAIEHEGVVFVPGTSFYADGGGQRHIRLNYTRSDDATIERGIARLGSLLERAIGRLGG